MASTRDLAEQLVPDLAHVLRVWSDAGLSYDRMTIELEFWHGIRVSRETVRRWCKHYGIEKGA